MIKVWFVVILLQIVPPGASKHVVIRYPNIKATIESMSLQFLTKEACQDGGEDVTRSVIRKTERDAGKIMKAEWWCDFYWYWPETEAPRIIHRNELDKE